jgi:putative membrane protein
MPGFLIRTLITMLGLYLASVLVPGVQIAGVAFFLTLPITIVTLGLFLLVLNAAMFGLVGAMLSGFSIAGLGSAILGALIVSITSGIASWYIGPNGLFFGMKGVNVGYSNTPC